MKLYGLVAALLGAIVGVTSTSNTASAITIGDNAVTGGIGTLTCSSCRGIILGATSPAGNPGSFSLTIADLYDVNPPGPGNSPTAELNSLNNLIGGALDPIGSILTEAPSIGTKQDPSPNTFNVDVGFYALKFGAGLGGNSDKTAFVYFETAQSVTWSQFTGVGGGISHNTDLNGRISTFNPVFPAIPLPATAPLFALGLAALGFVGAKRKRAS